MPPSPFSLAQPFWKPPFKHDAGMIVDREGSRILDVRGWGHLTGQGAHGLPDDAAAKIQDQVGDAVAALLTERWGKA